MILFDQRLLLSILMGCFFAKEVERELNDLGMDTKVNYKDEAEGYYAIHLYFSVDLVVPNGQMSSVVESCSVEL